MRILRRAPALLAAVALLTAGALLALAPTGVAAAEPPVPSGQPAAPARFEGVLPSGATWVAEVPPTWNGTLLLYSHGFNPRPVNPAQSAPSPELGAALLARGYAIAGSSYSRSGWALRTASDDQLATIDAVTATIGEPEFTIATGSSMGGLVTAQIAERAPGRVDGAFAGCGIVGGGLDLHSYQLDGLYTLAELLAPDEDVELVGFADSAQVSATVERLTAAVNQAQTTPAGRARVALAAAFLQIPAWVDGPRPPAGDVAAEQAQQAKGLLDLLGFIVAGRFDVEQNAGGNLSANRGVDYGKLLSRSTDASRVRALYRAAGLDPGADTDRLTRGADVTADPAAVRFMQDTSVVTGRPRVPVLTLHTTADTKVPVQHEQEYAQDVRRRGDADLLRQAYVERTGHCTFTPAEWVAGVEAVAGRVRSGAWGSLATPGALQARASKLGLGEAAFVSFRPGEFLGDR